MGFTIAAPRQSNAGQIFANSFSNAQNAALRKRQIKLDEQKEKVRLEGFRSAHTDELSQARRELAVAKSTGNPNEIQTARSKFEFLNIMTPDQRIGYGGMRLSTEGNAAARDARIAESNALRAQLGLSEARRKRAVDTSRNVESYRSSLLRTDFGKGPGNASVNAMTAIYSKSLNATNPQEVNAYEGVLLKMTSEYSERQLKYADVEQKNKEHLATISGADYSSKVYTLFPPELQTEATIHFAKYSKPLDIRYMRPTFGTGLLRILPGGKSPTTKEPYSRAMAIASGRLEEWQTTDQLKEDTVEDSSLKDNINKSAQSTVDRKGTQTTTTESEQIRVKEKSTNRVGLIDRSEYNATKDLYEVIE